MGALQHSYHPNLLWWHIESLCSHVDLLVNVNAGNHEKHLKDDDRDDDYDDGYGKKKDGNEENDDKEEQECEDADHGDEDGRGHEDDEDRTPGPRAPPESKRPSRKITALSYSWRSSINW